MADTHVGLLLANLSESGAAADTAVDKLAAVAAAAIVQIDCCCYYCYCLLLLLFLLLPLLLLLLWLRLMLSNAAVHNVQSDTSIATMSVLQTHDYPIPRVLKSSIGQAAYRLHTQTMQHTYTSMNGCCSHLLGECTGDPNEKMQISA